MGSSLPLDRLARESSLGAYYLDFRGIIPLVEAAHFGPLDPDGVPRTGTGRPGEFVSHTTTIAQYALALHDAVLLDARAELRPRLASQLDAVLRNTDRDGPWRGFIVHRWTNTKYRRLPTPWVSALGQGNAISALLRGHQLLGETRFLEGARELCAALARPLHEGGVRLVDPCGHLWFEEYPMDPPSHVLNGFVFALWGILDFARATNDEKAWQWWRAGVETIKAHLADFDCGFWSIYDLRYRELASRHYHSDVHVRQLDALYGLTGEPVFGAFARRWERFGRSPWRRGLWWLALRVDARRRGMRFD